MSSAYTPFSECQSRVIHQLDGFGLNTQRTVDVSHVQKVQAISRHPGPSGQPEAERLGMARQIRTAPTPLHRLSLASAGALAPICGGAVSGLGLVNVNISPLEIFRLRRFVRHD